MENKYSIKISWLEEEKVFQAENLEIPSLSFKAETKIDALKKLEAETLKFDEALKKSRSSLEIEAAKYNVDGIDHHLKKSLQEFELQKDNPDGISGVPSGFTQIDIETGGFQKSDLIVVGGASGMGKTAFALTVARNAAIDFAKSVVIFSLEMSGEKLASRLMSGETEIISQKMRNGDLTPQEWERLNTKITRLADAQIFIDDTPAISIFEIQAKCRRLKEQQGIDLVIIDYLQLISAGDNFSKNSREQEISHIVRSLKALAKELRIPVILLSQLSRALEARGGTKKPILSDLRESGAIEQDSDLVMFLYRPEYYQITEFEDGMPTQGLAEIMLAKHRHGAVRDFRVRFQGEFAKFTDNDGMGGMPYIHKSNFDDEIGLQTIIIQSRFDNDDDVPF